MSSANKKEVYEKQWKRVQKWRNAMLYLDENYSQHEKWILFQEFEEIYQAYLRAKYLKGE